ncbi:MAG: DUF362 domain-containing protein [Planctomycetota bacterium]
MEKQLTRRSFIKHSAGIGAASILGGLPSFGCGNAEGPRSSQVVDVAAVKGDDKVAMTIKAVDLVGGIQKYVPRGAHVCILPNAQRANPGTYTHPDIVRAVIRMCREAGAQEVSCLSWLKRENWEATGLAAAIEAEGGKLRLIDMRNESLYEAAPIPNGVKLKEARLMKALREHDVLIDMPITKDHAGNRFTGTLKNLMALNLQQVNMQFHTGNFKDDDIEHLDQCIADLNTIITPALCIVDATEFIITNGPFGPGKLHKPQKVVAGTDRVALDAYCAGLWGLVPHEIHMIERASEHGIGEIDLSKKRIMEVGLSS